MCATCYQLVLDLISETKSTNASTVKFNGQVVSTQLLTLYCLSDFLVIAINLIFIIYWMIYLLVSCRRKTERKTLSEHSNTKVDIENSIELETSTYELRKVDSKRKPLLRRNSILDSIIGIGSLVIIVSHFCLIGEQLFIHNSLDKFLSVEPLCYVTSILTSIFLYRSVFNRFNYYLIERQSQTKSSQSRGTNLFVLVFHCYWLLQTGLAGHKFLLLTAIGSELTTHLRAQIYIVLILVYSTISMTLLITVYTNHKKKSNTIQSESIIWNRITYLHPFSSLLSRATYSWFFPLLKQGYQRPIQIDDLGDLPPDQWAENQFDRFCKVYEQERINSKNKSRPVSLWKCYWKTFKYSLFAGAILRLLADIFALFGPISIRYILDYVKEAKNVTQESVEEMDELHLIESHVFFRNGFVLSFMVLITTCLQSTFSNSFNHYSILEGIHLRSALQCLIYKKSLKMTVSLGMDVGSIVNHMSQDSFNMMMMFSMVHYIWALPLKIFVLLSLLYFQLGISSMIGAAVVYILLPIQYYLASRLSKIQTDQLELSDKRLKKTSELLMSMKLLKLLGWELLFADQIKTLRDQELKILRKDSIYVAIITFITQATSVVVTLVTFALYPYIEGQPLSASTVFSGLALFNQLTVPLYVIPFVIPIIVNSFVSTKRLSKFLLQPEIDSCVPWRMSSEAVSKGDEIRGTSHQSKPELNTNNVNALNLMKLPNNGQTDCHSEKQQSAPLSSDFEIQITSGYFSWTPVDNLSAACLKKIDLRIRRGQLTIITGPIGSGKSSLISAMLGELVTLKGTVQWSAENQEIAYLPQNPWLLNVSLRENVLFGSPFEPKRYKDVIEACALEADIEILPAKDRTEIGEKGVNLSGGQRQRIGLARALYSKARTLILDSPLSALDNQVGNHVFQRGIKEYCIQNKRTVIMISHKLEYIKEGGQIIVLEKGEIKRQGTYAEILVKDPNFSTELEKMKVNENKFGKLQAVEEGKTFKERQRLRRMFTKQSLYRTMSTKESVPRSRPVSFFRQVSHDLTCPLPCQEVDDYTDPCPASPDIVFDSVESDRRPGSPLRPNFLRMISSESSRSRVSSSSSSILRRSLRRLISKTSENAIAEEMEDNKSESGQMLDGQADEHEKDQLGAEFDPFFSDDLVNDGKLIVDEDRETGAISKKIYFSYIKACSPYWASLVIALISLTQAVKVATDFWLAKWTESNKRPESFLSLNKTLAVTNSTVIVAPNLTSNQVSSNDDDLHYYITGYVFLSIITIIISLVTNLLAQITSIRAARLLHGQMLDAVVRAPIRFFESTPIGRILNRFSNDVSTIDKKLPTTLPLLLRFLLLCFAAIVVDLIVSPVFLVVAFPIISVYYILQHFFRYTSRELQRLDSLTKSPILSHFSQTLSGLSTIRAFKAEKSFTDAIHVFINTNNLAFLMVNCSNCWLGIVLDYLGGLILFSATLFTVFGAVYGDISPSFVGMSITYTLLVPVYLNWVVRNLANLEMHLSAVERIDSYSKLEPEQYSDTAQPVQKMLDIPANWPSKGQIQFETVSLSYHLNRKPVLTSISFVVNPGEKIGICGRTGSGKSSLIMALFKMINVTEGVIYIDDIDLSMVCSNVLRQRLSLVPQDIVLFAGTIRENIDPTNKYSDDQLWSALETCELKSVFKSLEDEILEDGSNLSAGQRQLLCLARALVKQRSVLIMDEATSSLDLETERLVNKIISKRSETVLSIVHHMSTALDFDKVMVIQNGSIAEFGPPRDLMTTKGSLFSEMVKSQSDDITYT